MEIKTPEILIVEDEEMIRMLARAILERDEYFKKFDIKEFSDGTACRAHLDNSFNPKNLASFISDYKMPGMNGMELIDYACVHREVKPTSCVFMSGNAAYVEGFQEFMDRRSGVLFLQKPFSPSDFLDSVRGAVVESGYGQ